MQHHLLLAKCYSKNGRQISQAFNLPLKSHPIQKKFAEQVGLPLKDKLHSEISSLIKARKHKVHKITIERYGKLGRMLLAKPCGICQEAIKAFGVKEVEYTSENGWVIEVIK